MSELVNAHENRANFRWRLLTTVSAIALLTCVFEADAAKAADDNDDRPPVWIELGGQLSHLNDSQEAFSPSLMDGRPSIFSPSGSFEKPPLYSIDETGKISFQPDGSDWVLSASVRYGRSSSGRNVRQQAPLGEPGYKYYSSRPTVRLPSSVPFPLHAANFAETNAHDAKSHMVLDFQAGKDIGMGMFGGKDGYSTFSVGVRFAQFSAKSNITLKSIPDDHFEFKYIFGLKKPAEVYHSNQATLQASRSFQGVGPSISWNASTPFAGSADRGELLADWGLNAAILFGRQKAKIHHQTTGLYHSKAADSGVRTVATQTGIPHDRSRSVTVPNVGGFAGFSFRIANTKVSAGYRADLFFGAMDGGIDAAKKENVGFYGPFASVSVGIGG